MKKVLLLGDSIRQGYCRTVKTALDGVCEVYFPEENGRFAEYTYRQLHVWRGELSLPEDLDLIHWNVGLWDTAELYGEEPLTPLPIYCHYIEKICQRLKAFFPTAKIIFATSTAVLEDQWPNPKEFYRSNKNTELYNAAAVEIVKKYGFEINDLYAKTKDIDESNYSDQTHLNNETGKAYMLKTVLKTVCDALDLQVEVDYEDVVRRTEHQEVLGM